MVKAGFCALLACIAGTAAGFCFLCASHYGNLLDAATSHQTQQHWRAACNGASVVGFFFLACWLAFSVVTGIVANRESRQLLDQED